MGFKVSFLIILGISVSSCSDRKVESWPAPSPQHQAETQIENSFKVMMASAPERSLSVNENYEVAIQADALEKEFLFRTQLIAQGQLPTFNGLKGRVVFFRKRGQHLYLVEATQGNVYTNEIPSTLLLARFPIVKESADEIVFDFNQGMERVYMGSDWHLEAFDLPQDYLTIDVSFSYINQANFIDNTLVIQQAAQTEKINGTDTFIQSYEIRYFVSPYQPDPSYEPFDAPAVDRVGFFTGAPRVVEGGGRQQFASRFHPEKEINFVISPNTPKEYQQAVIDGVLYWNLALGRDQITAVVGTDELVGPQPNQSMIQWIQVDDAGFAYADAQLDPRTGQILNGQVFLTSTFSYMAKGGIKAYLRRLKTALDNNNSEIHASHSGHSFCTAFEGEELARSVENLNAALGRGEEIDEATVLRVSQDYLRSIVAHEVGHVLGLRHNFAGSLTATYEPSELNSLLETYVYEDQLSPLTQSTNSTMEYQLLTDSLITGNGIRKKEVALDYDRYAMQVLYRGEAITLDSPIFCSDEKIMELDFKDDCQVFDQGHSYVESIKLKVEQLFSDLPNSLIERFIRGRFPEFGERVQSVASVDLGTKDVTAALEVHYKGFVKAFTPSLSLVQVESTFATVDEVNQERVDLAELDFVSSQIAELGGLGVFGLDIEDDFAAKEYERFLKAFEAGGYAKGDDFANRPYAFTPEEIATIKSRSQDYFIQLEKTLHQSLLRALAPDFSAFPLDPRSQVFDNAAGDSIAGFLFEVSEKYLLSVSGEFIEENAVFKKMVPDENGRPVEKTVESSIKLPQFKYELGLRQLANTLLKEGRGQSLVWGLKERTLLAEKMGELVSQALGGHSLKEIQVESLSLPAAKWVFETKSLIESANQ